MVMTMLPPVAEIVLWLLSLSPHPPSSPCEQWHTRDTLHDGGVQCCDSFFAIQLQQQMRSPQTVYNMWMHEWRKRRCWWRKMIRGGGISCVVTDDSKPYSHACCTCSFSMLIAIVKIFNSNVWQYIIRREKASRRVRWRKWRGRMHG